MSTATSVADPSAAPTTDSSTLVSLNPATGEAVGSVTVASPEQVTATLKAAREASKLWARVPVEERARRLERVCDVMVARRDEIARLVSAETGKPRVEALGHEVLACLDGIQYYVRNAGRLLAPQRIRHRFLRTTRSTYVYEPWGVVAVITPWNFPLYLTNAVTMSALFAGNAVINKPSEFTPLTADLYAELLDEAGLPEGVFQVLQGGGATGAALVDARPDKVTFTGSVATGRKVAMACAQHLIPHTLELGGKDPAIVLEDADLQRAARGIVWGAFCNAGQVCASIERVYVDDRVADEFTNLVVDHTLRLRQGIDSEHDVDVGPMANQQQFDKVRGQVDAAMAAGARALVGGQPRESTGPDSGLFYEPTVLVDVDDSMDVAREETFGPVLPIMRVRDEEDALEKANASDYGLTATVWTKKRARAESLARRLNFGAVYVNDHLTPSGAAEVSWGGVKYSGVGKTRGPEGLRDMCHLKHIAHERLPLSRSPQWYPYETRSYRTISELIATAFGRGLVSRSQAAIRLISTLLPGASTVADKPSLPEDLRGE